MSDLDIIRLEKRVEKVEEMLTKVALKNDVDTLREHVEKLQVVNANLDKTTALLNQAVENIANSRCPDHTEHATCIRTIQTKFDDHLKEHEKNEYNSEKWNDRIWAAFMKWAPTLAVILAWIMTNILGDKK